MDEIIQVASEEEVAIAARLFREYEKWLGLDLCFQGFEAEVAGLPGKYAPPAGRLLLSMADGVPAGCGALRDLGADICEIKRLFVRMGFRGGGRGRALIERLMKEARDSGYRIIRLDTHPPKMGKAVALYRSYGFYETQPYYDNPYDDVLFMEAAL